MDKELFYEIILFAGKRGYKGHLGMLPVMPICETSAESLAKKIFWTRRWQIIFSHDFAKAFWGNIQLTRYMQAGYAVSYQEYIWQLMMMVRTTDPFKHLKEEYEKIQSGRN